MKHAVLLTTLLLAPLALPRAAEAQQRTRAAGKVQTPPPSHPPLQAVDITKLPNGVERLDLFLQIGQSNMKGRGVMPAEPKRDPRIVMMHLKDDHWYLARHPLHLTGDAKTFQGADNAGVGPGLSFAETLVASDLKGNIGDNVHFDTASQTQIGQRYAEKFLQLSQPE